MRMRPSADQRAPGIYQTYDPVGIPSMQFANTRIAGFAGITQKGPMNEPTRLGNWDEFNGPMVPEWWGKRYPSERAYGETYSGPSAVDPDSDGDGIRDGADDQDFDGWSNVAELERGPYWVQPFNPCLPDYNSRTCSSYIPFQNPWPPFPLPEPPAPLPPIPLVWP